jgi:predicted TIM-barrel fold metal-dependent hydrolase
MNIEVRAKDHAQQSKLSIIDCDFHPRLTHEQMKPFLTNQWWSYLQTYGNRQRHGQAKGYNYPKIVPQASRRDAWPPSGGPPGSDVDFCREQHLDFYGIDYGILTPLGSSTGNGDQNVELSIALASAANEGQLAYWTAKEPRL